MSDLSEQMEQKYTYCDLQKYGDNLGQWFSRQYWKALEDISTTSAIMIKLIFKLFFYLQNLGVAIHINIFFLIK